jgi:hypothetical protein
MRDKSFMTRFPSTEHVCVVECCVQVHGSVQANLLHDGVANTLASICAAKRAASAGLSCRFPFLFASR